MTDKPKYICPLCLETVEKIKHEQHRHSCTHPQLILPKTIEETEERFSRIGMWEEVD